VAEETTTPKGFRVWDTGTGKLMKDYFGGSHYFTLASME
jgi:hypothetical protein